MRKVNRFGLLLIALMLYGVSVGAQSQSPAGVAAQSRTIIVVTEPNAAVWIDDVLRGKTDQAGRLTIRNAPTGARRLRVRANGFKETAQAVTAAQKGELKITLAATTDDAELAFQQAEAQTDKQKAVALYRRAAELRPQYAAAQIGLARALSAAGETEEALKVVAAARRARPNFAEASAVEGRIYTSEGDETKAVAAYRRAVREGKGFQPEAHTGLGLLYRDRAEEAASAGDLEKEKANLALAAAELSIAVRQLAGAPDAEIIYQLLGGVYEKMANYKKAIGIYQEFLRFFPDSSEASAIESFIVQLRKQMSGEPE